MMELDELAYLLGGIVPAFVMIEGRVFIDASGTGHHEILQRTKDYKSLQEAQASINITYLEDSIDALLDHNEWEIGDPAMDHILRIYEESWTNKLRLLFPTIRFRIERIIDEESNDLALKLIQD